MSKRKVYVSNKGVGRKMFRGEGATKRNIRKIALLSLFHKGGAMEKKTEK